MKVKSSMSAKAIVLCLATAQVILSGCASDYALLYVKTVNKDTGENFSARIYSGNSGQYLMDSPSYIILQKRHFSSDPNITLIGEEDCFKTAWQIITVTNWTGSMDGVFLPENKNEALLLASPISPCTGENSPPSQKGQESKRTQQGN
ncbi:hypothetical protein [Paraburkholderia sp. GAS32]|uniref:hypothetical protein n=1 Tax=Paraburkholderia sp. GAS32 TaxID=3035129 RepID=UPI003D1FE7E6